MRPPPEAAAGDRTALGVEPGAGDRAEQGGAQGGELVRFDGIERAVHWLTALLVLAAFATATALFVGPVAAAVGRRAGVRRIHVTAGLLLPVPIVVGLVATRLRGGLLRDDLRRIDRWTVDERRWLRAEPGATVRLDKFNPGQKLNAAFTGGALVLLIGSGAVMHWFRHFPLAWRSGASVVHDLTAGALTLTVAGHVLLAVTHPASLRSMIVGRVPEGWARRHAPRWLEEEQARRRAQTATPG